MRAVIDTNVLVSALLSLSGTPSTILTRWREGAFVLVISAALLDELQRVSAYPHLRRLLERSGSSFADLIQEIRKRALLVRPDSHLNIARDVDDNRLLEAAVAGKADVIVTGDRDLLVLGHHEGVRILTPRAFLDELDRR